MSKWQHSICNECWEKQNPGQAAHRMVDAPKRQCCFCMKLHPSGIMVHADPATTACAGIHEDVKFDVVPLSKLE